jgi:hypothetical protein
LMGCALLAHGCRYCQNRTYVLNQVARRISAA